MRHNHKFQDITGVILAGGRSKRMGKDKATLKISGTSMFDKILHVMQGIFSQVIISGNRNDLIRSDVPCFADIYPGSALGGLYTGLYVAKTELIFVISCDMPFPDPRIIRLIVSYRKNFDAVVPKTAKGLEPIFALYRKTCLKHMRKMLQNNHFRIYDFYPDVKVRYVKEEDLPKGWEMAFLNVNTPEEYESVKEKERWERR